MRARLDPGKVGTLDLADDIGQRNMADGSEPAHRVAHWKQGIEWTLRASRMQRRLLIVTLYRFHPRTPIQAQFPRHDDILL
jgi:hypothetical protein